MRKIKRGLGEYHTRQEKIEMYSSSHGECVLWTGPKFKSGYGCLFEYETRRYRRAHIVAYELVHGPVPAGKELAHSCNRKLCIAVAHLIPKTHKENCQDALRDGLMKQFRGDANGNSRAGRARRA